MSTPLWAELTEGLLEIYEVIGVPMKYTVCINPENADKFGNLIPLYGEECSTTFYGMLNVGEFLDKDVNVTGVRKDGEVAIVTGSLVDAGINPSNKDRITVEDAYGDTLTYYVTGIMQTPNATQVGLPFLITYLNVAIDDSVVRL